ncbi:hypothetical protein D3C81_2117710 [compost metagenome]
MGRLGTVAEQQYALDPFVMGQLGNPTRQIAAGLQIIDPLPGHLSKQRGLAAMEGVKI